MIGQILDMRIKGSRRKLLQGLGNSTMHSGALPCQELRVNGPPRQGVSKRELFGGCFDHELSRYQFFHDQEELLFIISGELLEKGKIKMSPGNSGKGQHLCGRF